MQPVSQKRWLSGPLWEKNGPGPALREGLCWRSLSLGLLIALVVGAFSCVSHLTLGNFLEPAPPIWLSLGPGHLGTIGKWDLCLPKWPGSHVHHWPLLLSAGSEGRHSGPKRELCWAGAGKGPWQPGTALKHFGPDIRVCLYWNRQPPKQACTCAVECSRARMGASMLLCLGIHMKLVWDVPRALLMLMEGHGGLYWRWTRGHCS